MTKRNNIIICFGTVLFVIIIVFFFVSSNESITFSSSHNSQNYLLSNPNNNDYFTKFNTSTIKISEPIPIKHSFQLDDYGIDFILYEDFLVKTDPEKYELKLASMSFDGWAKLLPSDQNSNNLQSQSTLRLMGVVSPLVSTPFNNTLYVMGIDSMDNIHVGTTAIIQNKIINEVSVVRDSIPIKFKNEIFTPNSGSSIFIFGIVYDPHIPVSNQQEYSDNKILQVEIKPIGFMSDGNLSEFPEWIDINIFRMPMNLEQNEPDYYLLDISLEDAPTGSYEIAVREIINGKQFVETITLTILESS